MARSTRVIVYTRFSPRPNASECISCDEQERRCCEYCAKQGWQVVHVARDEAISGGDDQRPVLWDAIGRMRAGMVLVATSPDRIARSVYTQELILAHARRGGWRIRCLDGSDMESDDPQRVLLRQVLGAIAEYERKLIASRTSMGKRAAMRRMEMPGPHAPWGFEPDPDRPGYMRPCESELEVVGLAMALKAAGLGISTIARTLDRRGYRNRAGRPFNAKTVWKWLSDSRRELLASLHGSS